MKKSLFYAFLWAIALVAIIYVFVRHEQNQTRKELDLKVIGYNDVEIVNYRETLTYACKLNPAEAENADWDAVAKETIHSVPDFVNIQFKSGPNTYIQANYWIYQNGTGYHSDFNGCQVNGVRR